MLLQNSKSQRFPFWSMFIIAEKVNLSVPLLSEQQPFESSSGSIGITLSAKYTEVPRSKASLSSSLPSRT